ncbi:MAG: ABC transporter substrate binding protein [Chloroflexota bacterium]
MGVLAPPSGIPLDALRAALRELSFIEGENLTFENRNFAAGSSEEISALAAELLAMNPDVIVAVGNAAAVALRNLSRSMPIVLWAGDPVESGLAESMAHPGGNVTGLSSATSLLSGKRLELLKATVPGLRHVAALSR